MLESAQETYMGNNAQAGPSAVGSLLGLVRKHPLVTGLIVAALVAPVALIVVLATVPLGIAPPLPQPQAEESGPEPSTADWASLHAFKDAMAKAGAAGTYIEASELDQRRPYRLVVKVTPTFMTESHAARTQFVQLAEGLWERVRDERKAGGNRAVLLVLGPRGQRIGGSTVMGLAEVD